MQSCPMFSEFLLPAPPDTPLPCILGLEPTRWCICYLPLDTRIQCVYQTKSPLTGWVQAVPRIQRIHRSSVLRPLICKVQTGLWLNREEHLLCSGPRFGFQYPHGVPQPLTPSSRISNPSADLWGWWTCIHAGKALIHKKQPYLKN